MKHSWVVLLLAVIGACATVEYTDFMEQLFVNQTAHRVKAEITTFNTVDIVLIEPHKQAKIEYIIESYTPLNGAQKVRWIFDDTLEKIDIQCAGLTDTVQINECIKNRTSVLAEPNHSKRWIGKRTEEWTYNITDSIYRLATRIKE